MVLQDSLLPPLAPNVAQWIRPYSPGPLTQEELRQLYEYGYVIKHNLFDKDRLVPVVQAVEKQVDSMANELFTAKKITQLHEDADFYTRLTALEKEFPTLSVLMHKRGVLDPEYQKLWNSPELIGVAHQVLGGDIAGHPVWNLRTKTPQKEETVVPWHQDAAYLTEDSASTLQLTAWIPLIDATIINGCMQVLHGGHRLGKLASHVGCSGGTWYIETVSEELSSLGVDPVGDIVTCEVPMGSVLFLNNLIPHRSVPNVSNQVRWSLDLRWQHPDLPNGFYGLKDVIRMASSTDPHFQVNWDDWGYGSRQSVYEKDENESSTISGSASAQVQLENPEDPFDSVIVGPWMSRWPLVHRNRHTEKWEKMMNADLNVEEKKKLWTKA